MKFTGSDLSTVAVAMVSRVGQPLGWAQMILPTLRLSHHVMCIVYKFPVWKHMGEDAISNVKLAQI